MPNFLFAFVFIKNNKLNEFIKSAAYNSDILIEIINCNLSNEQPKQINIMI